MSTATRAVTARIPHLCDTCHWEPGLRGMPTIAPGHRYLRHTVFPDGEANTSNSPWSLDECVACASERDPSSELIVAGACSMYCCGDVPCAWPLRHDGDHSCRRCAVETLKTAEATR